VRQWSLADLALDRPVTVGMTLIAMVLLGIIATFRLPLAFLPAEISSRIRVEASITRTSPEVLEREVVRPLEEVVAGIRDLRTMRVSTGSWGVNLNLEFATGTDIDARKLELRERIDRAKPELPELVQRIEIDSSQGVADDPVVRLRLTSDRDLVGQYDLLQQRVVRPLERIPGVARVELSGIEPNELEVALDVDAMTRSAVDARRLSQAVRTATRARSMGLVRTGAADVGVRTPGLPAEPDALARLPVARSGTPMVTASAAATATSAPAAAASAAATSGVPVSGSAATGAAIPTGASAMGVSTTSTSSTTLPTTTASSPEEAAALAALPARLGEVAAVSIHPREQRRGNRLDGRPAINVDVYATAGASAVTVSREIDDALADIRRDHELGELVVDVYHSQGEIILDTLGDLRDSGLYGGLIAIGVLLAFLRRLGTTIVASVSIPMSVLAATGILFLRGSTLDCIVMLGLVLGVGMLVDNAVVIVESITAKLQEGLPPIVAARRGAAEVGLSTVASTMSSVIVFLPLVVTDPSNPMSTYLVPLGGTFVIALLASLFISQTVVPLLAGRLLGPWIARRPPAEPGPLLRALTWAYAGLVRVTLRRPRLTLLLGLALAGSAAIPATQSQWNLGMPENQPDALPIRLELAGSTGYKTALERVAVAERVLLDRRDELGIRSVSCSYRDWGANCDAYPLQAVESEAELGVFQKRITEALPVQPGVRYHVNERDGWWGRNFDPNTVEFALKGEDMAVLMALSQEVATHLDASLPKGSADAPDEGGVDTINGPFNEGSKEVHVVLDGDRLAQFGLRAADVADAVGLAFQGAPLGQMRGPDGELSLVLTADGDAAEGEGPTMEDLRNLRLPVPAGGELPLAAIAELTIERAPHWLQRVNRETEVRMKVRFFGGDPKANKAKVDEALARFDFPPGYYSGEGTQWWKNDRDTSTMLVDLALCLLLVYAVMAALFEDFLQPLAILVTCLLGCVGAPWAMWLTGTTIDTVALIGLFILVGIVVNNGIMLVDRITLLRSQGMARDVALVEAGRVRLRPILMTATTTVLGLVPMLIHHPTLAGIYYHSIAIIVAGGLVTSTVFTLVFLPAGYVLLEDFTRTMARTWRRVALGRR
jgi:HAE1 family hydrophobic/amphiphilic exporter-1